MKINSENFFETESGDRWNLVIKESPNSKPELDPKKILIATTNFVRMEDAVRTYEQPGGARSFHLVLGKNGPNLVQMIPFDCQARSSAGFEFESIEIVLDYTPKIRADDDSDYIIRVAGNNRHVKVPIFPKEQLDGLLELVVLLCKQYGIKTVQAISEINPLETMPGPAFPLTQFRERLFEKTNGSTGGLIVLEEIIQNAELYKSPNKAESAITSQPLQSGTQMSIMDDYKGWVKVDVIQKNEGSPWLIGWVEGNKVQTQDYTPIIQDNRLYTTDHRQYRFVPAAAGNYDHKHVMEHDDVKFIIMHITTGLYIPSTIHTFTNPKNEVSAHLVIGRDGRIVQMVPFDHAAFHAGKGYWEEQGNINWHSIGIEVDNAGRLVEGVDSVYEKTTKTPILPGNFERKRHWKEFRSKPWHSFSKIQLDVIFKVVKVLEQHFRPIQELLEHERISLLNRSDPGPLFPMDELRTEVLGTEKLGFKRYRAIRDTTLYENSNNQAPKESYPKWPNQLFDCVVKSVDEKCNYWKKIEIVKHKKKKWKGRRGWVRRNAVKFSEGKYWVKNKHDFYKDPGDQIIPPCLPKKLLPENTEVRIQRTVSNKWCLVAIPDHEIGSLFLDGWVRKKDLELVQT